MHDVRLGKAKLDAQRIRLPPESVCTDLDDIEVAGTPTTESVLKPMTPQQQPPLPTSCWEQPTLREQVRGPAYLTNRAKVPSDTPQLTLFAAHLLEPGEHCPGATAALLCGILIPCGGDAKSTPSPNESLR